MKAGNQKRVSGKGSSRWTHDDNLVASVALSRAKKKGHKTDPPAGYVLRAVLGRM